MLLLKILTPLLLGYTKLSGIKTILISDGIVDSLGLIEFLLAQNKHLSFLGYKMLVYFYYKLNFSDECFFTCYPLKAKYAKVTFPVSSNFLPEKSIIDLLKKNKIENLVVVGKGVGIKQFKKKYQLKNYCYVRRSKKSIIINDKIIKSKNIVLAEEIINTNLIKCVYSYLGTAVFYAKHKKIKVKLILRKFRPFFLYYFLKKKFNSIV